MFERFIKNINEQFFHTEELSKTDEELKMEENFKEIISNVSFGDIIWVNNDDFDFRENGNYTPYIVIGKVNNKIIACRCSTNYVEKESYRIARGMFDKSTFVFYKDIKALDYKACDRVRLKNIVSLSLRDKKFLLSLLPKEVTYDEFGQENKLEISTDICTEVGDVVNDYYGGYALVIDKEKDKLICLPINSFDKINSTINFNEETFDFSRRSKLTDNRKYFGTLDKKQLDIVLSKYDEHLQRIKEWKELKDSHTLKIGSLIVKDHTYFYVFGIEGNKAKMHPLFRDKDESQYSITIGDMVFKPMYNITREIDLQDKDFIPCKLASNNEMEVFRKTKKRFIKSYTVYNRNHRIEPKNYDTGDVIESNEIFSMRFIVLGTYDDTIITISLDAFLEDRIIYREFKENDRNIFKSKNVNSKELKKIKDSSSYLFGLFEDVCDKKDERYEKELKHGK